MSYYLPVMVRSYGLTRREQYEELNGFIIDGRILDLGGSRKSGYHKFIGGDHKIDVANIKSEEGVDLIFDAEKKFPIKDETYDAIVCLNVLEHIFDYQNAVDESFRVLKKEGIMIGSTPFMQIIHGSPDDYFRYTKSALQKIFKKAGFGEVEVRELGTGVFGVIYELLAGPLVFDFIRKIFSNVTLLDKLLKLIKKDSQLSEKYMPLGYFFVARK